MSEQGTTSASRAARRIVMVVSSLRCGGAERVAVDIANYLTLNCECRVLLVTWTDQAEADFFPPDRSVERVHLGEVAASEPRWKRAWRSMTRARRLRRTIEAFDPHCVLSFVDAVNVLTILATRGLNTRVVVAERSNPAVNPIGRGWSWARGLTYRLADAVVAQTGGAADWLSRWCGAQPHVIPNAIRRMPNLAVRREEMVLSVGRLDRFKGFDVVIRAFAKTRSECGSWRLVILGDGPERDNLVRLCEECGIADRVSMPGVQTNVEHWMARAGIVAQGSRFEGFPNVLLEAMAMGTPVVATNCAFGPAEILEDRRSGRLVPVDDVDAMANALLGLMRDEASRRAFGEVGRRVRERYAMRTIMAQWTALLFPNAPVSQRGLASAVHSRHPSAAAPELNQQ